MSETNPNLESEQNSESERRVSGEKHAETAPRESEEQLSLLVESAKDYVIFTVDADGLVNMWNSGAERAFGYTAEEMLGKSVEILFTPEDRERGIPAVEMKTAREKGKAADERWHIRRRCVKPEIINRSI